MGTSRVSAPSPLERALRKLTLDAMTCEVLSAFREDGVDVIVLKGITLQRLYGEESTRAYGDADLYVGPAQMPLARAALARIGFHRRIDPLEHPFRVPEAHAEEWGSRDGAVDLHWRVMGIGASDTRAWELLARRTRPLAIGGETARALDDEATALLLALHAAQHGERVAQPREDLRRGIARLGAAAWTGASRLARELAAVDEFAAGLRMTPEGTELAAQLGLPHVRARAVRLRSGPQPPAAVGLLTVLDTPWRHGKTRALLDALFPDPEFMRMHFPLATRGRAGLACAYVARAASRAWQLPAAARAVRRSRTA